MERNKKRGNQEVSQIKKRIKGINRSKKRSKKKKNIIIIILTSHEEEEEERDIPEDCLHSERKVKNR